MAFNQIPSSTTTVLTGSSQPSNTQQNTSNRRWFDPARAEEIIRDNGGYEHVISPLYKRFLSEVIDTIILFIFKILIFVVIMDLFDVQIGLDLDFDFKEMKFLDEHLFSLTGDFLLIEILTKIVACLYESFFTVKLQATPGKLIMGLRILYAEGVLALEPQINHTQGIRALIFPANQLTFKRALFRSFAKNLLVTLLFPVYFMLFFYKSNQLIYDLLGKTVVVDYNPNPVLRRRT